MMIMIVTSGSVFALSKNDQSLTVKALKAMDSGKWSVTGKLARSVKDPLARKFLAWNVLSKTNNVAKFELITAFLSENPDWPRQRQLKKRAEETLSFHISEQEVLAWFDVNPPVSATGNSRLAGALLKVGKKVEARKIARDTWLNGNFPKAEERDFYKKFRRLLTREDHIKRLDRLLWEGKYWPTRRMLRHVSKDWQALAQARYSLRRRTGNVDALIKRVPDALKGDPGLAYERLRWRRRKGKDNAIDILKAPPDDLVRPDIWWKERSIIVRKSLSKGHITEAYRIVADHRLSDGAGFADAEWMSGWIALRFLKDASVAEKHFKKMYAAVRYPISRARGAYWAGRALEASNKDEEAKQWYEKAAAYPTTYYGQLAVAKVRPGQSLTFMDDPVVSEDQRKAFDQHELVKVVRILSEIGEEDRIRPFIQQLYRLSTEPSWHKQTATLARLNDRPDLAIWVAKRSSRDGREIMSSAYPSLTLPKGKRKDGRPHPESPIVLALIRQESAFRINAVSPARAKGLMQLMPATARNVAKDLRMRYSSTKLVRDPKYNMTLGRKYLGDVLNRFDNSYVLALSAYNAGPARAKRWIKDFGDPRDKDMDAIDWVEMIPFDETRNYVQRVLENLQVYRARMTNTEVALGLEGDLHQ
jgi:soluble lytic murein transglycosylase